MTNLEAITIAPKDNHPPTQILILLHGWGANANDVVSLSSYLDLPNCLMIFPDAPFPYPHQEGGKAWYGLEFLPQDFSFPEQLPPGLMESREILTEFIKSLPEITGVPLDRTILGGFSQGGAMTLDVGLGLPLGGLCSLSGYLHTPPQIGDNSPPVLMVHGSQDQVVPLRAALHARDLLEAGGVKVDYQQFEMGHSIELVVIETLQKFIESR